MKNRNSIFTIIGIIIVVAIVAFFYMRRYPTKASTSQSNAAYGQTSQMQTTDPQGDTTVTVTSSGFTPQTVTIKVGSTVTWVNQSGGDISINSDPHPIHTDYPPLNLGMVADGSSVSLTFNQAGTYGYHNHLNPSQKGTIIVK